MIAEAKLAQYFYEGFKTVAKGDRPMLFWRTEPQFESEVITEYGEVYATQEDIEDGVVLVENIPSGYEVDFNTGAYRKILKREPLYKMRMRLVIPEYPEFEALSAKPEGEPLPRLA